MHLSRRRLLLAASGAGCTALCARATWHAYSSSNDPCAGQAVTRASRALGTKVSITAIHHDEPFALRAIDDAFAEIEAVEASMSIYRPESDLSRLNRTRKLLDPHPYLCQVLRFAAEVSALSEGAFDVTVQPLWETFARAQRGGQLPAAEDLRAAAAQVDWRSVVVADDQIELREPARAITLNGIAQGFAADRAMAALKAHGIEHALIDAGELSSLGANADRQAWRVGVQHPREPEAFVALARLDGRCLATSGDYATQFTADGRLNHIFDPRTGVSPGSMTSVSIAAPTALESDALSTACFVLSPEAALELVRRRGDVDALLVLRNGRMLATAGFPLES
jgi:FAD:protein FMN transferase